MKKQLNVVKDICKIMDSLFDKNPYENLIIL